MSQGSDPAPDNGAGYDARKYAPSYERNIEPICDVLGGILSSGTVLELGSGTGQHIASYRERFPNITWFASEPDEESRRSCDAWAGTAFPPALNIDASSDWADDLRDLTPFDAIISANVIHISPIAVLAGILRGASKTLKPGGLLIFYGPFAEDGKLSEGNAAFDASLKSRDPSWGVRDLENIKTMATGFTLRDRIQMPANNLTLVFVRD